MGELPGSVECIAGILVASLGEEVGEKSDSRSLRAEMNDGFSDWRVRAEYASERLCEIGVGSGLRCNGLGHAQPLVLGGIAHVRLPIYAARPTADSQSSACSPLTHP